METCKAAVITGFNDPTEMRDVQMPDLEPTGMLVEVEAATLCGTDVHIWHNAANPKMLPYIPGHETAGRIVAINGERYDVHGDELKEG
ncbi:MAG: alcohol dehydrogenase catalytic domain-containing protein, partial [Chloroflexi bacterium]|nr:alcohol dehydrogenase catalytic domain-containing protein [Chloroflexota bacterium]